LRVLFVASEAYPLVKTGGLGDVCGALPAALAALDVDVRLLLPGYPPVLEGLEGARRIAPLGDLFGGEAALVSGRMPNGVPALAVDAPHLYLRPGNIYVDAEGGDWADNHLRFAALAWVAADPPAAAEWRPEVIHAHDWQAGLAPAYVALRPGPRPATVMTVHNLAFQGLFPPEALEALRLPPRAFAPDGVEFYGRVGFLKAGLVYADRIATVSPTYAREILTTAFGCGLDGLLRARAGVVSGILNGLDTAVWDPARDGELVRPYGLDSLEDKSANKTALQRRVGLAEAPERLLFGVISRLTDQKGFDVLLPLVPRIVDMGGQLVLLGTGDRDLEAAFTAAAAPRADQVAAMIGYDEALAHAIQGGADALLVPSRFEPCGLTQLAALRYGTVPIVAKVGGLADSVVDADADALARGRATGLQFSPVTGEALAGALERAFALYRQKHLWRAVQRRGMAHDVGWATAAAAYRRLYSDLLAERATGEAG
jgi:starch synthase